MDSGDSNLISPDRLTDRARLVLENARKLGNSNADARHVLMGILQLADGVAFNAIQATLGQPDISDFRQAAIEVLSSDPGPKERPIEEVVALAIEEAKQIGQSYVATEHLLLALTRIERGRANRLFSTYGISTAAIRAAIHDLVGVEPMMNYFDASDEESFDKMREMFGPTQVDQQIRQAIHFCWMGLPKEKRNVDELERQVRRLVDRAFRDVREDFDEFFSNRNRP